ncbi:MAG: hypothetical protein A2163_07755 [Actinobacteria bacterium RBG_13_35_12]|nr:MAG: hypothetical protein A2163_07755 [Actinobacteria bacterium RBG_13_35_12]
MIDQIFCFFFCAKVISHQVTYQQPYVAKTEEIQQEEDDPLSTKPSKGASINDGTNAQQEQKGVWKASKSIKGYVSHYSAKWGACLGCKPFYRNGTGELYFIMANGEELRNDRYTIACNHFPLGTKVTLLNTRNQHSIGATVTDTGGFNSLNRIADLTPLVAQALDSKTGGNGFEGDLIEIKTLEKQK